MARPRVVLSVATSVDGCIDDTSPQRLILSGPQDLDRVDGERAAADAILVGASTIRRDDPRLLVRSAERIAERVAGGRAPQPLKATISSGGRLDPSARFFTTGEQPKLVYLPAGVEAPHGVRAAATVVPAGDPLDPALVLADLHERGVRTLLVEGGTAMHTLFLTADLVDELQLAVAPIFVGNAGAPRFVGAGVFPHGPEHRMRLAEVRRVDDVVLARYLLGDAR
ncbi:RibD family protein [Pseudonocardia humida]|uniref:RibD family protein n=1 Tax=Pseudonocardia humida TaxID=2800819 RepID=UPI00207D1802|nr:dihydrofolate reductase family protein [Pseudonocardia humida]